MEVTILRDGEEFGPFSLTDVRRHLAEGSLLCSDFARHEKLFSWVPINELLYEPAPSAPAPLSPPPEWEVFFSQSIDCRGHLDFVDALLRRHNFEAPSSLNYRKLMQVTQERAKDYNLYVAVVGEFSTGKSTFINALMKRAVLSSDVLQGTTVSATFIRFGPHFEDSIEINLSSGEKKRPSRTSSEQFGDLIHRVTAVEANAVGVKQVNIDIRSPSTLTAVVLIDTPGLNADNPRHAEVTANVVRTNADLAIIITSSVQPLSMVLTAFLREHLEDTLARCLVALTKFDKLESSDRNDVLSYVQKRYIAEFGLKSALILPLSPLALLARLRPKAFAEFCEKLGEENINAFTTDFLAKEVQLIEFVEKYRWTIVAERQLRLLDKLLHLLIDELVNAKNHCRLQNDQLEKIQIANLHAIAKQKLATLQNALPRLSADATKEIDGWICYSEKELITNIMNQLDAAQDLNTFYQIRATSCVTLLKTFSVDLEKRLCRCAAIIVNHSKDFQTNLSQELKTSLPFLTPLNIKLPELKVNSVNIDYRSFEQSDTALDAQHKAANDSKSNAAVSGGVTGGAIGLALSPVLGPIGPLLGIWIGKEVAKANNQSSGTSVAQARRAYKQHLNNLLGKVFGGIKRQAQVEGARLYKSAADGCENVLFQYCKTHGEIVDRRINENKAAKQKWQHQYGLISQDEAELLSRLDALRLAKQQIPAFDQNEQ